MSARSKRSNEMYPEPEENPAVQSAVGSGTNWSAVVFSTRRLLGADPSGSCTPNLTPRVFFDAVLTMHAGLRCRPTAQEPVKRTHTCWLLVPPNVHEQLS